jgi:hypothetical protein
MREIKVKSSVFIFMKGIAPSKNNYSPLPSGQMMLESESTWVNAYDYCIIESK